MTRLWLPSILMACLWSFTPTLFGQKMADFIIVVTDKSNSEPLPFSTVRLTEIQLETDINGKLRFQKEINPNDTLFISFLGYQTQTLLLDTIQNRYSLHFSMEREFVKSTDVRISLGINPAHKWIKLAQTLRETNDLIDIQDHSKLTLNRTIIGLQDIGHSIIPNKLKHSLWDLVDTLTFTSNDSAQAFLPVFHSQTLSRIYHQRDPLTQQEFLLGSQIHGVGVDNGDFISQLTGASLFSYNVYKPSLTFLEKGITSPIASDAFSVYNYQLVGVDKYKKLREFMIRVSPKYEGDVAFSGYIWIQEETGAITKLILELNGTSNINFIKSLKIVQEFQPDTVIQHPSALKNSRISIQIENLEKQMAQIIGMYEMQVISTRKEAHISDSLTKQRITVHKSELNKEEQALLNSALNPSFEKINMRIDSVKNLKPIKNVVALATILIDGYYGGTLPVEFGPYFLLGSYNPLEGFRTRIGLRTSFRLSTKYQMEGFMGYGFRDSKLKYGGKFTWQPNVERGTYIKLSSAFDVELMGFSDNDALGSGNDFNTALNMIASPSVSYCRSEKIELATDIIEGLNVSSIFSHRRYQLPESQRWQLAWFDSLPSNHVDFNLNNTTLTTQIRYEPRVFYVSRRGRRHRIRPAGPAFTLSYMQGIPGFLGSEYHYSRWSAQIEERRVWGNIGRSVYRIRFSKVLGTVPFPLLDIPLGNQTPAFNNRSFNQMQLFEFVSDQTFQWQFEHHFNGYLLNRIPYISKLKLREVIHTKGIIGSLTSENKALIPHDIRESKGVNPISDYGQVPYIEAGIGIGNIFRFFRIDAIWRVTHRNLFPERNFGILGSAFIRF
jgi:hypothetical protein